MYTIIYILPELFLSAAIMALLMIGVFIKKSFKLVYLLTILSLMFVIVLVLNQPNEIEKIFNESYIIDKLSIFMKTLTLIFCLFVLLSSKDYIKKNSIDKIEYPILILSSVLGMLLMISSNDLIVFYLGLELQSLSLYILTSFKRNEERSTEAGLKFFVLSALSSGLLLYGCSLIYGFTGTTNFDEINLILSELENLNIGILFGLIFILVGLAFKIAAVPFHMWTPDVYEGAPTPITAFFAVAPKIAAMALLVRTMVGPFGELYEQWQQVVIFISVASMLLGAFAAIWQTNIKRLLAYSSIGHVGFALVGLAAGSKEGISAIGIYMTIYLAMNIGAFGCVLSMRRQGLLTENIDDLAGLARNHPLMAAGMGIFMFSMAGIPPLAGFFGKFYIFLAAVNEGLYLLAIVGVLTSVVGAYYYLRIVKIMYFDEPADAFDRTAGREIAVITTFAGGFTLLFFIFPSPIVNAATKAAAALFSGG